MAGLLSQYISTVKVPLFDNPLTVSFGYTFDAASYGPVISTNGQTQGTTPLISYTDIIMPMVGGNAEFTQGVHNAPGFSTGNATSYFDGFLHYLGQTYPLFPPVETSGGTWMRTPWKPQPGITVTGQNYWSQIVDTFMATNKGYNSQIFPANYRGKRAEASFYGTGSLNTVGIGLRYRNAFQQGGPFPNDPGPSLWDIPLWFRIGGNTNGGNIAFNRMTVGAQGQFSFNAGYDNCAVVTPSFTFATEPGRVGWLNSADSLGVTSMVQELHLDIPSLENAWTNAGAAHVPFLKVFPYGMIATLFTNGAGPTGQKFEVVVFNSDCSAYYLIQWVPQDANSLTQISSVNASQVAIDEQGIVWFQGQPGAGLQAHVSTSFSPTGYFIPVIQAPPLNPFILPCYNTCSPVPLIER